MEFLERDWFGEGFVGFFLGQGQFGLGRKPAWLLLGGRLEAEFFPWA